MSEQAGWDGVEAVRRVDPDEVAAAKAVVRTFHADLDAAAVEAIPGVLDRHTTRDFSWRGLHPFGELFSAAEVAERFWMPLHTAFAPIQRRPDVFMGGANVVDDGSTVWVVEMGHLLGLFDRPWLDIPPTRRMVFVRYAEFHRVADGAIAETAMFFDLISVMKQAGHYPLPPPTGSSHIHPGPLTHDGVMVEGVADPDQSALTLQLVHDMGADLNEANEIAAATGDDRMPIEVLAKSWHDDMIWSGPEGIGATYTIDRYQQQHSYPFRFGLSGKTFNGHVARLAEGDYAAFFGWPNLTNAPTGGFLGLPGGEEADMRVVDVYRRDGDKLAENWVFIDLPHWLHQQGLDLLERMRQLNGERL